MCSFQRTSLKQCFAISFFKQHFVIKHFRKISIFYCGEIILKFIEECCFLNKKMLTLIGGKVSTGNGVCLEGGASQTPH